MPDVLIVAGARPNFMRVKPVLDAIEDLGLSTLLVHSGQHYDEHMSDVFFTELGLRLPDRSLGAGSGTHATQTAAVMTAMESPDRRRLSPGRGRGRRRELHGRRGDRGSQSKVHRRPRRVGSTQPRLVHA